MASTVSPGIKTARFSKVVKECGRPVQCFAWQDPKTNKQFMRAVKEQRVMPVKQYNVGTKKAMEKLQIAANPKGSSFINHSSP
jgi:hypothetical protein